MKKEFFSGSKRFPEEKMERKIHMSYFRTLNLVSIFSIVTLQKELRLGFECFPDIRQSLYVTDLIQYSSLSDDICLDGNHMLKINKETGLVRLL